MSLIRAQTLRTFSRLPRMFSTSISPRGPDDHVGRSSGATAHSSTFSKKEQAEENKFARDQEAKQIAALRKKLEEQKVQTQELEQKLNELEKNGK
ncbi:hypothetical protein BT69DRAFT_1354158 [Atractiella rhizophila]|nr:hypothetical protein BT69DRAFT_1354158 [Atractiella rhizophila]